MGGAGGAVRRGIALVGARAPWSEAVLGHLRAELARGGDPAAPEDCRLLAGPDAAADDALSRTAALVYAAAVRTADWRDPVDPADARAVLRAAVAAGVPRIIVLSSTEAIQPSHHHPGLLSEDRFQPRPGDGRWSRAWRDLEQTALDEVAASEAEQEGDGGLTILRTAPVPVSGARDVFSRLLDRPVACTVPGRDPSVQLLAPEDLARALVLACRRPGGAPVIHVVPRATAPLHRVVRLAGGRRLPVPRWLQRLGRRLVGRSDPVDLLCHPWTAGGTLAQEELGFVAERSTARVAYGFRGDTTEGSGPAEGEPAGAVATEQAPSGSRAAPGGAGWEWGGEAGTDFDDFGMDRAYVERYGRTLFRFLHDVYWRIEARGVEHVPRRGRGVLTGVHRGFMPFDGVMALHLLVRERGRYPRFLLHPTLTKFPFLGNFMTKLGGILASRENADWVLERDGLVGIYPEGIRGAFTPYRRAYELGKFGRDEYVRMALRHRAPIIPFVTVGSAEIFPILGRIDWAWWKRVSEWPYLPITPTFPLLPVPLPSKWHTRILEPYPAGELHPPEAADDRQVVAGISREIRRRMKEAIDGMLARRRSVFFGSVFEE